MGNDRRQQRAEEQAQDRRQPSDRDPRRHARDDRTRPWRGQGSSLPLSDVQRAGRVSRGTLRTS